SKKFTHDDGSFHYKKHKIYLYKEDFEAFRQNVEEMMDFIIDEKGTEVISERHQKDFKKEEEPSGNGELKSTDSFTDINFDDI
ncbi:MAG: DUF3276 family protein, partial [Pricia sp.]|nr:DUF3276 family protein [Pricia sp.]